ncbi:hypothetical protein XENORESO_015850, partial [Xenotaenia resolanae]
AGRNVSVPPRLRSTLSRAAGALPRWAAELCSGAELLSPPAAGVDWADEPRKQTHAEMILLFSVRN